jgi:hypothetical protein
MILFGCLLAFGAAVAPRVILVLAWIFGDRWNAVWDGQWIWPLLGIAFLPYTTIMYLLVWSPALTPGGANIEGWDWMWIVLGLILDFMKWGQMLANRKEAQAQTMKYYPSDAPNTPSGSSSSITAAVSNPPTATRSDSSTSGATGTADAPSTADPSEDGSSKGG